MKKNKEKYANIRRELTEILIAIKHEEEKHLDLLQKVDPAFAESAYNLIHYRTLRRFDLRRLHKRLGFLGLSRLARVESHVLDSIKRSISILTALEKGKKIRFEDTLLSIKEAEKWLKLHARDLLGKSHMGRRPRIMVTLPTQAATDYDLIRNMVSLGMDVARINCAHDGPEVWLKMIKQVRLASKKANHPVKIAMDLGGPKIRTGPVLSGPKVFKYRPQRDTRGRVIKPFRVWLSEDLASDVGIPLENLAEAPLKLGSRLWMRDARDKKRRLILVEKGPDGWWAEGEKTTYFESGRVIFAGEKANPTILHIGRLPASEAPLLLMKGDHLRILAKEVPALPAERDVNGTVITPATISCTAPEIFSDLKPGESVLFDDGKIRGEILSVDPEVVEVKIDFIRGTIGKLRADKGINFPESELTISGLTEKDRQDLIFVAEHADLVNFSFVNCPEDVEQLLEAIGKLRATEKLGVVLKIETQRGFNNLTEILLTAMRHYPVGVMIARGDLAIESGWENIARIQEEILTLCRAAHVPDIWATQVLESLAKTGLPSRAEITDAAMAQRADCVMLNKGPYILHAIRLLDIILRNLADYQDKNAPLLPAMEAAR
jgi:pyruvate kinase